MAEEGGLELNSLGGGQRNPAVSCGEADLGVDPQVFDAARRARDWPRWLAFKPDGKSILLNPALLRGDPPTSICAAQVPWDLRPNCLGGIVARDLICPLLALGQHLRRACPRRWGSKVYCCAMPKAWF